MRTVKRLKNPGDWSENEYKDRRKNKPDCLFSPRSNVKLRYSVCMNTQQTPKRRRTVEAHV